jgi:hypothetical protein
MYLTSNLKSGRDAAVNLVNELQVSAEKDDVLTVLRKTKRLASKLGRKDIAEWLQAEQGGYFSGQSVPEYRLVGTTLAYNTNGFIPAGYGQLVRGIEHLPASNLTCPMPVKDSIGTILSWIEGEDKGNGIFYPIPEGSDCSRAIRSRFRFNPMIEHQITFLVHLNACQIKAIPEGIKDKVLDWACALETAGVNGDGLSFSAKEKEIAHTIIFNINNSHVEQLSNSGTNLKGN